MKIKCPKCGEIENIYLYGESWEGSIERETFDYAALFCCEECGLERKIYFWGDLKIDNRPFQDTL